MPFILIINDASYWRGRGEMNKIENLSAYLS